MLAVLGLLVARVTEASEGAQPVLTVTVSATQCLIEATLVNIWLKTQRWTLEREGILSTQRCVDIFGVFPLQGSFLILLQVSVLTVLTSVTSSTDALVAPPDTPTPSQSGVSAFLCVSDILIPDLLPPTEQLSI